MSNIEAASSAGRYAVICAEIAASLLAFTLAGCAASESDAAPVREDAETSGALQLDPSFVNSNSPEDLAEPAGDYTLFEADPVRPVAVLHASGMVAVTNTVDDYLELFASKRDGVERCGAVKVGMRPVAVAVIEEHQRSAELWVVNHLSDSVSVVRVDLARCEGEVTRTLAVGDEPRDIVVARTRAGKRRVFLATAHRGQHHPDGAAALTDQITPAGAKRRRGMADVLVFDPGAPESRPAVVNLFTDVPRALAVGDGVVYAAGFHTGNRTSAVGAETALARGLSSLVPLLSRNADGRVIERDGELVLADGVAGRIEIEGGIPAVTGSGRCMPDPRDQSANDQLLRLCVRTDARNRVERVLVQREGQVDPSCQCTSGDGTLQPATSVIVQFFDTRAACGAAFRTFPDGARGCWLDRAPGGAVTPAAGSARQSPAMAWNDHVKLGLPDEDVFAIRVDDLRVASSYSGVGTIVFGLAVHPGTGKVFAPNTDALNLTRFEGVGTHASTTVRGHLHESRITVIDPARPRPVIPVHLNTHIDYARCCERDEAENRDSFAFPTAGAFSPDGKDFYFTALGSNKVGVVRAAALGRAFDNRRARRSGELREIELGDALAEPSGPVGLALDARRGRLYVKTHFTNELVVIDAARERITARVALPSPEPDSITRGRPVLYNARQTSAHGDSACASCHVFGNFDGLSWDLGDPSGETVRNPGPFVLPTDIANFGRFFALDSVTEPLTADFRSNKGPMNTQTLRGLANHGALHWRGDRTRRFQDRPGVQPNSGSFDEDNSFNEFAGAVVGLNGNDAPLAAEVFQAFTNFSLQLTLPPNPIRSLNDSLTPDQSAARALFFGCASMTDADYRARTCTALDGTRVNLDAETSACRCQSNPFVDMLRGVPDIARFAALLRGMFQDPTLSARVNALANDGSGLPPEADRERAHFAAELARGIAGLQLADSAPDARGLLPEAASTALLELSNGLLRILRLSELHETPTRTALLELLIAALPAELPPEVPLRSPEGLFRTFDSARIVANVNRRVLADEAARGTADFRDLLAGCDLAAESRCVLRVTDGFTCHTCHTLDPRGNLEFEAYRPGFFGTSGEYSFEGESQVFKVPHLRNQYQKVGMFGAAPSSFFLPESVLGPRKGGFFAEDHAFVGPQVRGFGFFHDGTVDTLHRFHGAQGFVPDPGELDGLDPFLPRSEDRPACVQRFRAASAADVESAPEQFRPALALCSSDGPVPESCFSDPFDAACEEALSALGETLGDPEFPSVFHEAVRPLCFQLGSMLEGGSEEGVCYPSGLRERAQMEDFMLAFDSNLKPIVGQQVTLNGRSGNIALQRLLLGAAQAGECDVAVRAGNRGYLVTAPNPSAPDSSVLETARAKRLRLKELSDQRIPLTFTCYPPQRDRAEARRSAFDREP